MNLGSDQPPVIVSDGGVEFLITETEIAQEAKVDGIYFVSPEEYRRLAIIAFEESTATQLKEAEGAEL